MSDNNQELFSKKPKTSNDYKLEEIDGELLAYSPATTRSIYLNPSASIIWLMCNGEHSVAEMIDALKEEYPDAADSIEDDVISTIETLRENQAISLDG